MKMKMTQQFSENNKVKRCTLFFTNGVREIQWEMNINPYLIPCTKVKVYYRTKYKRQEANPGNLEVG